MKLLIKTLQSLSTSSPDQRNLFAEHLTEGFSKLKVKRAIEDTIIEYFKDPTCRGIILTGNAGDGKTTIINDLLKHSELSKQKIEPVLDFSAISISKRDTLIKGMISSKVKKYLIAANEGALIYCLNTLQEKFPEFVDALKSNTLGLTEYSAEKSFGVRVVNLNKVNNSEDAYQIIEKVIAQIDTSNECPLCKKQCHVFQNLNILKNSDLKKSIREIYNYFHQRGDHLTIRDILIHVSYLITSGESCKIERSSKELDLKLVEDELNLVITEALIAEDWDSRHAGKIKPLAQNLLQNVGLGYVSSFGFDKNILYEDEKLTPLFNSLSPKLASFLKQTIVDIRASDRNVAATESKFFFDRIFPKIRRFLILTECANGFLCNFTTSKYYDKFHSLKEQCLKNGDYEQVGGFKLLVPRRINDVTLLLKSINHSQSKSVSNIPEKGLCIFSQSKIHIASQVLLYSTHPDFGVDNFLIAVKQHGDSLLILINKKHPDIFLEIDYLLYEYLMRLSEGEELSQMHSTFESRMDSFIESAARRLKEMSSNRGVRYKLVDTRYSDEVLELLV